MYGKEVGSHKPSQLRNSQNYHLRILDHFYNWCPAFTDVFDEESWYIFVVCFVAGTILVAFILSRYITIKAVE